MKLQAKYQELKKFSRKRNLRKGEDTRNIRRQSIPLDKIFY